jgi:acyl-CoA synthetase (AMP-forming)/AMP-acid ligase II
MDETKPLTLIDSIRAMRTRDEHLGISFAFDLDGAPRDLPYRALYRRIAACVEQFRSAGVAQGTRVIYPFETSEGAIVAFLALLAMGALPLSVRQAAGMDRARYTAFLGKLCELHRVDLVLDASDVRGLALPVGRLALPALDAELAELPELPPIAPGDLAFVQFSSGSTGVPKGVPITHENLVTNIQMIIGYDRRHPGDRAATWLPLYHDMGLIGGLLSNLVVGNRLYISRPMQFLSDPVGWLRFIASERITASVFPDFAIAYMLRFLRDAGPDILDGCRFDALKMIFLGSEPIHIRQLVEFEQRLAPFGFTPEAIKPCYGMAEAVLLVTCVSQDQPRRIIPLGDGREAISVGAPHAHFELRIIDEAGDASAEGEIGEIQLRGGTLAPGYFESDAPFHDLDGYFPTGDLGMQQDGQVFIMGRASDRIKINAQSYFASDFEQALASVPFVRPGRTAAIQVDGRIVLLLESNRQLEPGPRQALQHQVVEAIVAALGIKLAPEDVVFVRRGQIERTSSGKVRRKVIADAIRAGQLARTDGAARG